MALGDLLIRVGIDANRIDKDLSKLQKNLRSKASKFSAIGSSISIGLSAPLGLLGKSAISTAAEFDTLETGLQVLAGSAEAGSKAFQNLKEFSAETPFQLQDLVRANNTLMGFGLSADEANGSLKNLGDIAAVMGSDLGGLAVAFGQSAAAGVAMTQDLNQFVNNGLPIYELLGDITGKNAGQIKEMASQGQITFPLLQQAIANATSEGGKFFEGMKKGSQTIGGVLSTFKDRVSLALGTLGSSVAEAINFKAVMDRIGQTIQKVTNYFANLDDKTKKIIVTVAAVVAALGPAMFALGSLTNVVNSAVSGLRLLNTTLLANPFGIAAAAIAAVVAGFVALYKNSESFRNAVHKLIDTLKGTFTAVFTSVKTIIQAVKESLGAFKGEAIDVKGVLLKLGEFIGKYVVKVFQLFAEYALIVVNAFIDLYNSSETFRGILFGLVAGVGTMIKEVLGSLGKFAKAIVLLFEGEFKAAGETALAGGKQLGMSMFTAAGAAMDGFKKGVESKKKILVIDPSTIVPEPAEIEKSIEKTNVGKSIVTAVANNVDKNKKRAKESFDRLLKEFTGKDIKPFMLKTTGFETVQPYKTHEAFSEALGKMGIDLNNFFQMFGSRLDKMGAKFKEKFTNIGIAITAVFQIANDLFNRNMENQLSRLDEKHNKEIAQIDASTASEEVKTARKKLAEKKYQAEVAKLKKKEAIRDKALAIFQATINTATAVAKVIANPIQAALVAALGAAQIAMIAATPIPMASGGILTAPTNILAGEYMGARNNPEIVAPLDKLKGMIGDTNISLAGNFRLEGNDLILAVEQANKSRVRQGGISLF